MFLLAGGLWTVPVLADESVVPDLVGTWNGTSDGYHAGYGYFHPGDYQYVLSINEQEGRIFHGTLIVSGLDPTKEYPLSGVVSHDMKTLEIAEYGTGTDTGYLLSPDEMELILLVNDSDNFSVLCKLKKET